MVVHVLWNMQYGLPYFLKSFFLVWLGKNEPSAKYVSESFTGFSNLENRV